MRKNKKSLWCSAPLSIMVSVAAGLAVSSALTLVFSAAILLFLKDMGLTGVFSALSLTAGSFTGSYICGRYRRHRGALNGIICGAVIFLLLSAAGLAFTYETAGIKKFLLLAVSGCTGGIYGVNSKRPASARDQ